MSTPATINPTRPRVPKAGLQVTQLRVIGSEWTKFHTLRSSRWTVLIAVTLTIGLGALFSLVIPGQYDAMGAAEQAAFDATSTSLYGILFSQLAMGVLGVLLITAEYSTGMIRSTLAVIPKRLPMLWAKLTVFAGVTFVVTLIAALVAFLIGQSLMSSHGLDVSLSIGSFGKIIGAAGYVTLAGMIGVALGSLLRNTAAGISTFVGVFFVLPLIVQALPASISSHFVQYLPSNAGGVMFGLTDDVANALSPFAGFAVLAAYAAVLVGIAGWRLKAVDA
jgi:ABC-2 type transport system permease protein